MYVMHITLKEAVMLFKKLSYVVQSSSMHADYMSNSNT